MGDIELKDFAMTNKHYQSGIALEEYNGSFSVVAALQKGEGTIKARWGHSQKWDKEQEKYVPSGKPLLWKITLGNSREEALKTWERIGKMIRGEVSDYDAIEVTPGDDSIPF